MDAVIAFLQLLIYIDMSFGNTGKDGIFLLPHDTVLGIEHLHKQGLATIGKEKTLSIHNIRLEPKILARLVNAFVSLEIDKFGTCPPNICICPYSLNIRHPRNENVKKTK